jgi:uncharacterized protein (TIRG00374 family)
VGFIAYLLHQVGPSTVWEAGRSLSWWLPLILLCPFVLVTTLDAVAWRLAFPGPSAPFPRLWAARIAGEAVNTATPTASVGGEPVKAYLLRPWVPFERGLASVIVDKTTITMGQTLFLAGGLLISLATAPAGAMVAVMLALLALEVVAVGGFVLVQTRGVAGGTGRLLRRLGIGPGAAQQARLDDLDRALRRLYGVHGRRLALAVACHLVAWAVGGLEIYLVLRLLAVPVSLPAALAMESFGTAVKFASFMIPASLGALEGGNVAIFAAFGIGGELGLTYTLVRRLREAAWVALGLGALALLAPRPATARAREPGAGREEPRQPPPVC